MIPVFPTSAHSVAVVTLTVGSRMKTLCPASVSTNDSQTKGDRHPNVPVLWQEEDDYWNVR